MDKQTGMTRQELHQLIDQLPDGELNIVARMLEGLQASRPAELVAAQAEPAPTRPASPIRPVGSVTIRPRGHDPLASQFSQLMTDEAAPENPNLLRKVMFARVSDLISWVNRD